MQAPLISILIANYNNSSYICETLDSVVNQTYNNIEIIIVDDASEDSSLDIIGDYIFLHPDYNIQLYKNSSNYGCGRTKRKCVDIARGEYFAFLDPEDTIESNTLELLLQEYKKRENCGIIYTTHYLCNDRLEPQSISVWPGKICDGASHLTSKSGHISAFALCKKTVYDQTLGINPKFRVAEDQDLYLKMEEINSVYFYNFPLYYYRKHNNNISWDDSKRRVNLEWSFIAASDAYMRRRKNKTIAHNFSRIEYIRFKLAYLLNMAKLEYKEKNYVAYCRYIARSFRYLMVDRNLSILKTIIRNK